MVMNRRYGRTRSSSSISSSRVDPLRLSFEYEQAMSSTVDLAVQKRKASDVRQLQQSQWCHQLRRS